MTTIAPNPRRVADRITSSGWAGLRVYLAGPMTGRPCWNFRAFAAAAVRLRLLGAAVTSPPEIAVACGFDPAAGDVAPDVLARIIEAETEALLDSDAVLLLPDWHTSEGTRAELSIAEAAGIPAALLADVVPACALPSPRLALT